MTRVLLVRHGQSESNVKGTFTGQLDYPLSSLGLAQAERTARFILENYHIDAVYSSDLSRAYHTGLPVAEKLNLQIHRDIGLREIYGGEWEGMRFTDLSNTHPEAYRIWQQDMVNSRCPGGESVPELAQRVWETFCRICKENPDKTVLIATHATPIRTILWHSKTNITPLLGDSPWVSNSSVSENLICEGCTSPLDNIFAAKITGDIVSPDLPIFKSQPHRIRFRKEFNRFQRRDFIHRMAHQNFTCYPQFPVRIVQRTQFNLVDFILLIDGEVNIAMVFDIRNFAVNHIIETDKRSLHDAMVFTKVC